MSGARGGNMEQYVNGKAERFRVGYVGFVKPIPIPIAPCLYVMYLVISGLSDL